MTFYFHAFFCYSSLKRIRVENRKKEPVRSGMFLESGAYLQTTRKKTTSFLLMEFEAIEEERNSILPDKLDNECVRKLGLFGLLLRENWDKWSAEINKIAPEKFQTNWIEWSLRPSEFDGLYCVLSLLEELGLSPKGKMLPYISFDNGTAPTATDLNDWFCRFIFYFLPQFFIFP